MLLEYLKLIRSFNLALTGIAPVLGAVAMWDFKTSNFLWLFILFLIGSCSHIYGFVLNDYLDVNIDRLSRELSDRPLVSGKIKPKNALKLALGALIASWILSLYFYQNLAQWLSLFFILIIADALATAYNITSKKLLGMDFLVAGAVCFLIIFGAATVFINLSALAIIVALIGFAQVLYMNVVNGGLKDIDHDWLANAKTLAVKLGAKTTGKSLEIPLSFKLCAYTIITTHAILVISPFLILGIPLRYELLAIIIIILCIELYFSSKLLMMKQFDRRTVRKNIGLEVIFMYALAPVMLSNISIYFIALAFIPPLGFVISNLLLHSTILNPKTM